jgi:ribosome recycling factor
MEIVKAKEIVTAAKDRMQKAIDHLDNELLSIRAGKANPVLLNPVMVDYYGSQVPLSQVSNISSPDARTLIVQPWEKSMIAPIEKAILAANLGFNPQNNGEQIRINVPALTEERRKNLVKQTKNECENTRISLRNTRRDAVEHVKKLQKDGLPEDVAKDTEIELQKQTDAFSKKVDELFAKKEKEIMTV